MDDKSDPRYDGKSQKIKMLKCKHKDEEYKILDKEIKEQCNKEKEKWLNEQCKEIEELKKTNIQLMHKKVKEIANLKSNCSSSSCIKAKNGIILIKREEMMTRWEECIEELFF